VSRALFGVRRLRGLLPLYVRNLLPPSVVSRVIRRFDWINRSANFLLRFCSAIACVEADIKGAL
jgi:hypothetical protein